MVNVFPIKLDCTIMPGKSMGTVNVEHICVTKTVETKTPECLGGLGELFDRFLVSFGEAVGGARGY